VARTATKSSAALLPKHKNPRRSTSEAATLDKLPSLPSPIFLLDPEMKFVHKLHYTNSTKCHLLSSSIILPFFNYSNILKNNLEYFSKI
jgi:hypothetical protein